VSYPLRDSQLLLWALAFLRVSVRRCNPSVGLNEWEREESEKIRC
jgi:hypothetical protein